MPEHVHVHAPHELGESSEGIDRRERIMELVAALMLSIATISVAWSGYQAARWSGQQAQHYGEANTARNLANRAETIANEDRLQDLLNFNRWLEASAHGDKELTGLYERRFRDEFRPAFEAWVAQDPLHNEDAIPTPLKMPEYKLSASEKSDGFEKQAAARTEEAHHATETADRYVFVTVFFAAVMFFAGMSLRFAWPAMRVAVLALGFVFLGYGLARLLALPKF